MMLKTAIEWTADLVMPRHCRMCHKPLMGAEPLLCSSCETLVSRYASKGDADGLVARLFWGIAPVRRAGIMFEYMSNLPVTDLLADIKYRGHAPVARRLGRMLGSCYQPRHFFEGIDLIVPVPLAAGRLRERGFNQSQEIALGVSEITSIPVDCKSVVRIVDNVTQTHLTVGERLQNVLDIFAVSRADALAGKHILVIDDVITSGATVGSLLRCISQAVPDSTFSVLALGRGGVNSELHILPNRL